MEWSDSRNWDKMTMGFPSIGSSSRSSDHMPLETLELGHGGVQVDRNKYPSLQQNATQVKNSQRVLPKPIVVKVEINGHSV